MLIAEARGWFTSRYEILNDGVAVAEWEGHTWVGGGELTAGGRVVTVTTSGWTGRRFRFAEPDGRVVAEADDVGRRDWVLATPLGEHAFQRRSLWRPDQAHLAGGVEVGRVQRMSWMSRDVQADLPMLQPLVQLWVTVALVAVWEMEDRQSG